MLHDHYWKQLGLPINPFLKRESDSAIAKVRPYLDQSEFDQAWAEGEKMTIEEAIDLALKSLEGI
jgi:hypothetical protein